MSQPAVKRVVVALDKFKGSLSADEAVAAVARPIARLRPGIEVIARPIADGGEGTLDIVLRSGFKEVRTTAAGPLMNERDARFAARGAQAFVELAEVAGISCLPDGVTPETALKSTTFGVGQLVAAAISGGARDVTLAVGGSATTDGGAGAIAALGASVLDSDGEPVGPGGGRLGDVARLDLSALRWIGDVAFTVATDVDNPLTGPLGAAATYAAQKGAGPEEIEALSEGLEHWADVVADVTREDRRMVPGAGAAGGMGFGAIALLGAEVRPGIDVLLDLAGFESDVDADTLVVIGEGSFDSQSLHGKGPMGVARRAQAAGARVIGVTGRCEVGTELLRSHGIETMYELRTLEPDPERSMADASDLLGQLAERIVADGTLG